jgi:hypothetical protein
MLPFDKLLDKLPPALTEERCQGGGELQSQPQLQRAVAASSEASPLGPAPTVLIVRSSTVRRCDQRLGLN